MRILHTLLLLPVLITAGTCAQAAPSEIADKPPSAPQPAIAAPAVPAKLAIESLAGNYKGIVDEQELQKMLGVVPKQPGAANGSLESLEASLRMAFDQATLTIKADGTYEARMGESQRGNIKIDGNTLFFRADSAKPLNGTNGSNSAQCSMYCAFTLVASADGKTLLLEGDKKTLPLLRGYVKQ